MCRGRVARLAGIDHGDAAAGSGEDQGRREAGGASADHHHVVFVHGTRVTASGPHDNGWRRICPRLGYVESDAVAVPGSAAAALTLLRSGQAPVEARRRRPAG
ncbi:hypothetical protein NLS1_02290 [Nocardioides sp. LS1]|nr:hypothetical protein NLS1_02290 [Nocardioides sp. LS1]